MLFPCRQCRKRFNVFAVVLRTPAGMSGYCLKCFDAGLGTTPDPGDLDDDQYFAVVSFDASEEFRVHRQERSHQGQFPPPFVPGPWGDKPN